MGQAAGHNLEGERRDALRDFVSHQTGGRRKWPPYRLGQSASDGTIHVAPAPYRGGGVAKHGAVILLD